MVIGSSVPEEKTFKGNLPYLDVAVIMAMWPRHREETFHPLTHGGSIWNLTSIGRVASKMFDECEQRTVGRSPGAGLNNPWGRISLSTDKFCHFCPIDASFITKPMRVPEKSVFTCFFHTKA